jgi:hypothetical protein
VVTRDNYMTTIVAASEFNSCFHSRSALWDLDRTLGRLGSLQRIGTEYCADREREAYTEPRILHPSGDRRAVVITVGLKLAPESDYVAIACDRRLRR